MASRGCIPELSPRRIAAIFVLGAVAAGCSPDSTGPALPLRAVRDVSLPGGTTRFDYQSIDVGGRRLYLAHLGDDTVDVVDLEDPEHIETITGIARVHGVATAPDLGLAYATATGTNELVIIDTAANRIVERVPVGEFPDGIAYDPDHGLVLVSNKDDGTVTVADARSGTERATIDLGDETGNVAYDPAKQLAWVATRTPEQLAGVDPVVGGVIRRIDLDGCDGAHGVYVNARAARAYVACENNARLLEVDLEAGRVLTRAAVGRDPDVLAFDPGRRRLYVAAESGTVTAFDTTRNLRVLGRRKLADSAHTIAVDPATHLVYLPLEEANGKPALRILEPTD